MSQKTYKVSSQRLLHDLNGDSTNFDLTFTATSKNNAPFEVLVVDQATLDSAPPLQYKKASGVISGNIVADKNQYQNYFLILKADNPCEVTVKTIKKEIPPNLPPPAPVQTTNPPSLQPPKKQAKNYWKTILVAIVVIGGVAILYHLYTENKKKMSKSVEKTSENTAPAPAVVPIVLPTPTPAPIDDGGLLARLKNLPMA